MHYGLTMARTVNYDCLFRGKLQLAPLPAFCLSWGRDARHHHRHRRCERRPASEGQGESEEVEKCLNMCQTNQGKCTSTSTFYPLRHYPLPEQCRTNH